MIQWMPSPNQVAQTCHFFIAATIVLAAQRLGVPVDEAFLLVIAWALPKEFIFDLVVEQDTLENSAYDFTWYLIGGFVTFIASSFLTYLGK